MEDYALVVPGGDEDLYDEIIETLSETEWTGQLKPLQTNSKEKIYSMFGHTAKATVAQKAKEATEDEKLIKT